MPEMSERIAELRRELESNPLSRQFYQLGELLRRDGRAAEATAVLRGGLAHHPRYVAAWVALGRACLDLSAPKDAAAALHEALELDAQNPVAWRLLGEARLGGGDRFGALDAMEHALQLAPGDEVLRAAVDSLASETWPPGPAVVATEAGALDSTQPMMAAVDLPMVVMERYIDEVAEPGPEPPPAVESEPLAAEAPALPAALTAVAQPAAEVAPPAPAAPPPELLDPFAVTGETASAESVADVFVLPVEAASFADEPFGFAAAPAPAPAQPLFLAEFAPFEPGPTVAPPPAPLAELPPAEPEPVLLPAPEAPAVAASESVAPQGAGSEPQTELTEPPAPPAEAMAEPAAGAGTETERHAVQPTLTLARLHLQQQDFRAAIAVLERIVTTDPNNQEARDLLDLVHDMMAPLPGELPLASVRERRIAALQGWLASLTLGQERVGQ